MKHFGTWWKTVQHLGPICLRHFSTSPKLRVRSVTIMVTGDSRVDILALRFSWVPEVYPQP